jgi:hypothetical protein
VGGAAAVGVYFWMKNSNDPFKDPFEDPLIQGKMGIGTTFTYDVTEYKENGETTAYTGSAPALKIVGQSGSYYMLADISGDGSERPLAMIHKETGKLRFSNDAGKDSIEYGGKNISLTKWEWKMDDSVDEDEKTLIVLTFSSSRNDAVPYKIYTKLESEELGPSPSKSSLEATYTLSSTVIKDPVTYTPSDKLGKGYIYSLWAKDPKTGKIGSGEVRYVCIAEGDGERFLMIQGKTSAEDLRMERTTFQSVPDSFKIENLFSTGLGTPSRTAELTTIDGKLVCDVHVMSDTFGGVVYKTERYIDKGLMYYSEEFENGELVSKLTLSKRLSR